MYWREKEERKVFRLTGLALGIKDIKLLTHIRRRYKKTEIRNKTLEAEGSNQYNQYNLPEALPLMTKA